MTDRQPMRGRSRAAWWGVVLEAPDARALARFYAELLGWSVAKDEPSWATVAPPSGVAYLAFQTSPQYVRPVWPAADGRQQMMMHLDVEVDDLEVAVADALPNPAVRNGRRRCGRARKSAVPAPPRHRSPARTGTGCGTGSPTAA
jgi:catechol 2,3-dioxygenase-like lactoylglutathione lyase family enzyme